MVEKNIFFRMFEKYSFYIMKKIFFFKYKSKYLLYGRKKTFFSECSGNIQFLL